MYRLAILLSITALLTACKWVQLSPEGADVQVITQSRATNCTRVGTTSSATSSRVLFMPRGGDQVQNELVILARNEAGLMGGNAIVADSIIQDGRQRFIVYNCR